MIQAISLQQYAIIVEHLTVAYSAQPVLWDISVAIKKGTLLGIIGPNGAGKTTFIKAILGLVKSISGKIKIDVSESPRHALAYVPQRTLVDWDFPINVFDVVLMGRYAHIGWIKRPSQNDRAIAWHALERVGLIDYAYRPIGQLSGGQQQRVFLARALTQEASIYLLDEPFNGVDIATEKMIVSLLKGLCAQGKTVIVVHHDLQTLAEYFDWLLLLNTTCVAYGPLAEVLKPEYMCSVYGDRNLFSTLQVHKETNEQFDI
ncbi:MAG: ABC transporter ATP-binding protein [Candidatus Babeliales bacterium]